MATDKPATPSGANRQIVSARRDLPRRSEFLDPMRDALEMAVANAKILKMLDRRKEVMTTGP